MQTCISITTLALVAALGAHGAQDSPESGGLVQVDVADEMQFDTAGWRERLIQPDLELREASYDELIDRAREDRAVRDALRKWSLGTDELAWTSRLALREFERSPRDRGLRRSTVPDPLGDRFRLRLEDSWSPFPHDFLRDLEERLNGAFRDFDTWTPTPPTMPGNGFSRSQSESFKLESTPDGVRIEIQEDTDGDSHTQTFEGETLEEILDANPELREKIDMQSIRDPFEMDGMGRWPADRFLRGFGDSGGGLQPWSLSRTPRTDVLGVRVHETTRELDGVGDGVGLEVTETLAGTIAREMGIRAGDVLIELNGKELRSTADVREVLQLRAKQEELQATLIDAAGARRTLTWTPRNARVY